MKRLKEHSIFIYAFSFTILVFLWFLIIMQRGFVEGDNFVQFFPWFKAYSTAIKSFNLPFWVRSMQSGFPLMAEGQIGGFYPLNMLMFFLLPFRIAYNYSVILHFIVAGIFTYLYARRLGACQIGGYLASLTFCFGSAYAGCFYNIVTLRTLAWFPAVLLLIEVYFDKRQLRYLMFAAIIFGFQMLAGFIQMAAYSGLFYVIYYLYKLKLNKENVKKGFSNLALFLLIAFIISLVQVLLTYQLAGYSGREGTSLGFALWRSFSPLGILGTVFPYQALIFNAQFYVGILSLFFVMFSFYRLNKDPRIRPLALTLFVSIFFALGIYNPIYVAILKLSNFYMFRNPSKFLFFGTFALSVLAGRGFTTFFDKGEIGLKKRVVSLFRRILFILLILFFIVKAGICIFRGQILRFGSWYVNSFVLGQPHHRHDLEHYLNKVRFIYTAISTRFSLSDIFAISSLALIICLLIIMPVILRKRLKALSCFIIFIDLFAFSFYGVGFRREIKPFSMLSPDRPGLLTKITEEKELFRIMPFGISSQKLPNWSMPNANMIYGIESVASYTPLASKEYREALSELEVVDDSLGLLASNDKSLKEKLPVLRLLNTKYIVSYKSLNHSFLKLVSKENETFLYTIDEYLPRVFFTKSINTAIRERAVKSLKITEYRDGLLKAELITKDPGFLIFSESYYPGWKVSVDGEERPLLKVKSLVQGVEVKKGKHAIVFEYKPKLQILK